MAHDHPHHHQSTPFCYTDFEPNHELFNLQAGMEMLGLPESKQHRGGEGFFPKVGGSSSTGIGFSNENLMITGNPWPQPNRLIVDDSSLRCLFPVDGNEQPSQGLSLSLWNSEHLPSNISRDGFFPKPTNIQQQQLQFQDGRFFPASPAAAASHYQQTQNLKSSRYLIPAQELLNEFCNLKERRSFNQKSGKTNKWEEGGSSSSNSWNQSLYSMDLLELQKRKAQLLSILEEVDRRYKRYCEQMRAVVSSFEAVAGEGSATVYSAQASKAMSRHFRCLRDGIVSQIHAAKKAMGEKDPGVPGTTKGETPRLKVLDQCIRQHKAFQQAGVMESHPWRPQRGLPERSVSVLRAWLFEHFLHPYPSDVDKHILARQTGLSRSQVSNWFINARVRLWKPMVEEMYLEETKEQDNQSSDATADHEDNNNNSRQNQLPQPNPNPNPNPSNSQQLTEDQKPPQGHLLIDTDSLSSIVNTSQDPRSSKSFHHHDRHRHRVPTAENFGGVDLDFSSYSSQNFGGNGVSLTLGLQQHNEEGMSISFSQPNQHSLFDGQPVQFSNLDGEGQNLLPYRNLLGSQLLHDLAG